MKRPAGTRHQRGIAVLTAMLVVTIATLLAVKLAWDTALDLRRTESLLARDQAQLYGLGAEAYASALLEDALFNQSGDTPLYTRSDEMTACGGFAFTLDEGGMTGGVCDLQARFNLNNLVTTAGERDPLAMQQFRRLIEAVSLVDEIIDIDAATADAIVESAADWIDPDISADFAGAEDDTYTSGQPPYRAANFWFTSVSELRAVRGVSAEIFLALVPHVAALPVTGGQHTLINVNTATVPVLMSLGDAITVQNAEQWVIDSEEEPFEDETPFAGFVDPGVFPYLGYSSSYFELKGFVSVGATRLGLYSLLESDGQAVKPRLRQFDAIDVAPAARTADTDDEEPVTDDE
ncbi:MAG: type II secretion system minor pseudopilin GspK [Gammaproteobacteria bacterium]|nr:type II secretion system minor pseudopilin GspK [Gammaproteobacteria bacterium]